MHISRIFARPMLSSIFVVGGIDAIRHPETKVKAAEAVVTPLVQRVPALSQSTETLIKLNAAVQIGAGALLAVGKFRRLAALALIGSIIPTTLAGHRFWEEDDDESRAAQRVQFLKNVGLLGGLILAAMDTEGSPSLGWRARRQGRRLGIAAAAASGEGKARAALAVERVAHAGTQASSKASHIAGAASHIAGAASHVAGTAGHVAGAAGHVAGTAGHVAGKAGHVAGKAAHAAGKTAVNVAGAAGHVAGTAGHVAERAGHAAGKTASKVAVKARKTGKSGAHLVNSALS